MVCIFKGSGTSTFKSPSDCIDKQYPSNPRWHGSLSIVIEEQNHPFHTQPLIQNNYFFSPKPESKPCDNAGIKTESVEVKNGCCSICN